MKVTECGRHDEIELHGVNATAAPGQVSDELQDPLAGRTLPAGVRPNYDVDGRPRTNQRGVDLLLEALIQHHKHPRYDFFHHIGKR
jgi:hypothetical protein